jgi:hypothetical protein
VKISRRDGLGEQMFQTWLNDRAAPGRNGSNLQFVRIDPPDVMAVVRETRRGYGADVAEPEDCDLHALMGASAVENPRENVAIHKTSGGSPKRYTRCLRLRGIYLPDRSVAVVHRLTTSSHRFGTHIEPVGWNSWHQLRRSRRMVVRRPECAGYSGGWTNIPSMDLPLGSPATNRHAAPAQRQPAGS